MKNGKSLLITLMSVLMTISVGIVSVSAVESDFDKCGKFNDVTPANAYC